MKIQFEIIRSQGSERLCYKSDEMYVDVSNPMLAFTAEDEFEIVEQDKSLLKKEYEYNGCKVRLVPQFYGNGWPALTLETVEDGELYTVLSVNLEDMDAIDLPDRTFIDTSNNPEAMEFLVNNGLATDTGYKRSSGWVEYPMARLNLPLLFQHDPKAFQHANINP